MKQRPLTSQKGAAAVELAIVFSLLILFIFGMIEFSLYLFNQHVITNAAREGARYGVVSRPESYHNDQIIQKVIDYSQQHLVTFGATDTLKVTILPEYVGDPDYFNQDDSRCTNFEIVKSDGTKIRCELKVTVQYPYDFLFLKLPPLNLDPEPIKSVAKMKME
jgi:Flp pilus assembly protein TadG